MSGGTKKVNKVCKSIMRLTDQDFEEAQKTVNEQKNYTHLLKDDQIERLHLTGEHNQKVLEAMKEFRRKVRLLHSRWESCDINMSGAIYYYLKNTDPKDRPPWWVWFILFFVGIGLLKLLGLI